MNSKEIQLPANNLHKTDSFSNLWIGETKVILAEFIRRVYSKVKAIVRQGCPGRFFTAVYSTENKVLKRKGIFNRCPARPGRGFTSPAAYSVKTAAKTVLLILSGEHFRKILDSSPAMAKKAGPPADRRSRKTPFK